MVKRICLVPHLSGVGGMVSFQARLAAGLEKHGYQVSFDLADRPYASILVIGGTRNLAGLWCARRAGIPIVQRLDGMNWIHRKRRTGWQHFMRAEFGNLLLALTRSRLASKIVYQSEFSQRWWEGVYGPTRKPCQVVYNGVNLEDYTPEGVHQRPTDRSRILLVEGNLGGGYEGGLETAVQLGERLAKYHHLPAELVVVGRVSEQLKDHCSEKAEIPITFSGLVPRHQIPEIDRSAHLLFAADLNAACPNSAIEALACGLPVAAFDTGALKELVSEKAGRVVPYGGNPWELDTPDVNSLVLAAQEILGAQASFRAAARQRAVDWFGIDQMVSGYLQALVG